VPPPLVTSGRMSALPEPDLRISVTRGHEGPAPTAQTPRLPDLPRTAPALASRSGDQREITPLTGSAEQGKGQAAPPRGTPRTARPLPGQALPQYPESAREDGLEGLVILIVDVGADGRVLAVRWAHRSGVPALDYAAREAILHWRFQPATDGEGPVSGHAQISVQFSLQSAPGVAIAQMQR
jgi:protein TonB